MMTFKPVTDKVLIQLDVPTREQNGIIIPDSVKEKHQTGTIVAIGPEVIAELTVGTRILLGGIDGVKIDDKYTPVPNCVLVRDEQVRGICTDS